MIADHLGTPLELYDQKGQKTWQAQLDSYGAVRQGRGQAQDCLFTIRASTRTSKRAYITTASAIMTRKQGGIFPKTLSD